MQAVENEVVYLIGDTETCGIGKDNVACEVAWIEVDPVTLEIVDEFDQLIDPQHPIQPGAQEVHGLTNEMLADEPTIEECRDIIIKDKYAGKDVVLIAHNAPFDYKNLLVLLPISNVICTLAWSRRLIDDTPNHKLQTLREHFGYPAGEAHRALADCYTTRRVLKELLQRSGFTLEQFARNGEHTIYVMPWGKFKGTLMAAVPVPYLKWLWDRDELEINMRESVKKALDINGVKTKKGQKFNPEGAGA